MISIYLRRALSARLLAASVAALASVSTAGAQASSKSGVGDGRISDIHLTAKETANANGVPIALAGHPMQVRIGGSGTCDITVIGTWRKAVFDSRQTLPATVEITPDPGLNTIGVYSPGCHGAASTAIVVGGTLQGVTARSTAVKSNAWELGQPVQIVVRGSGWCGEYVLFESQGHRFQEIQKSYTHDRGLARREFSDTVTVTPRLAGIDTVTLFPGPICAGSPQVVVGQVRADGQVGTIEHLTASASSSHPAVPVLFTIAGPKGARCDSATLSFGDGQSLALTHFAFDLNVPHTYGAPGRYVVAVRAHTDPTHGVACRGEASAHVDVSWPLLTKLAAPGETVIGRPVVVALEGEPASCGDVAVNFGDGMVTHLTALPGRVEHVYKAAGTRTITASASARCSGTASATIVVDAPEKETTLAPHKSHP